MNIQNVLLDVVTPFELTEILGKRLKLLFIEID